VRWCTGTRLGSTRWDPSRCKLLSARYASNVPPRVLRPAHTHARKLAPDREAHTRPHACLCSLLACGGAHTQLGRDGDGTGDDHAQPQYTGPFDGGKRGPRHVLQDSLTGGLCVCSCDGVHYPQVMPALIVALAHKVARASLEPALAPNRNPDLSPLLLYGLSMAFGHITVDRSFHCRARSLTAGASCHDRPARTRPHRLWQPYERDAVDAAYSLSAVRICFGGRRRRSDRAVGRVFGAFDHGRGDAPCVRGVSAVQSEEFNSPGGLRGCRTNDGRLLTARCPVVVVSCACREGVMQDVRYMRVESSQQWVFNPFPTPGHAMGSTRGLAMAEIVAEPSAGRVSVEVIVTLNHCTELATGTAATGGMLGVDVRCRVAIGFMLEADAVAPRPSRHSA
jgi:hypothetical protein